MRGTINIPRMDTKLDPTMDKGSGLTGVTGYGQVRYAW